MAESDSILQLGIEAAREGNREEARNLFRLLTRQDPSNSQGWLWLAGVAENRDERQVALERVIELDPSNEMAFKGLQAMGVRPAVRANDEPPVTPPVVAEPDPIVAPALPPDDRSRYDIDEDDPFAALDSLSEAMAASPAAVRREASPSDFDDLDDLNDAINADDSGVSRRGPARSTSRSVYGDGETRTTTTSVAYDDDDDSEPARRGLSPLLIGILALALLLLLGLLLWRFLLPGGGDVATGPGGSETAAGLPGSVLTDTTTLTPTGEIAGGATAPLTPTGEIASGGTITDTGVTSPTVEAPPPAGAGPEASGIDPATAAPAVVPANTPLESNGWLYDFNQPTYASPIVGGLGSFQPQGRFVVVLVFLANRSGTAQPIPADFFVLKDAQGRVSNPLPDVSNAYVQRGINADLSQSDAIPADGLTRSVALIFDVAPDATDLVFFARGNPSQGWLVLSSVQ